MKTIFVSRLRSILPLQTRGDWLCFNNTGEEDDDEEEANEEEQISSTAYRFFVEEDATILERSISRVVSLCSLFLVRMGKERKKKLLLVFWSLVLVSLSDVSLASP